MSFNALKEKGIPLEKQLRTWHDIVKRPFNRVEVDCYTRTRQILMNGIEVEAWNFKHHFARTSDDIELNKIIANPVFTAEDLEIIHQKRKYQHCAEKDAEYHRKQFVFPHKYQNRDHAGKHGGSRLAVPR